MTRYEDGHKARTRRAIVDVATTAIRTEGSTAHA